MKPTSYLSCQAFITRFFTPAGYWLQTISCHYKPAPSDWLITEQLPFSHIDVPLLTSNSRQERSTWHLCPDSSCFAQLLLLCMKPWELWQDRSRQMLYIYIPSKLELLRANNGNSGSYTEMFLPCRRQLKYGFIFSHTLFFIKTQMSLSFLLSDWVRNTLCFLEAK